MSLFACLPMVFLLVACGSFDKGDCRAWCEDVVVEGDAGSGGVALCADVPETVRGCGACLDAWAEAAVTEASAVPSCGCAYGMGQYEPYEACMSDEAGWEPRREQYEAECVDESARYGYHSCPR